MASLPLYKEANICLTLRRDWRTKFWDKYSNSKTLYWWINYVRWSLGIGLISYRRERDGGRGVVCMREMRNVYKISISRPGGSSLMREHFFFVARQPVVGQCLLIAEASWTHSVTHATLGKAPPDEWSACRRDLSTLTL